MILFSLFNLIRKVGRSILLPLTWSAITQILLSLPGSLLPHKGLFSIPNLDKLAHFGLFAGLVFFWRLFFYFKKPAGKNSKITGWIIVFAAVFYGIVMEFVQLHFIPNRSFEYSDMVADAIGSLFGYLFTQWFIQWMKKNKMPENKKPL